MSKGKGKAKQRRAKAKQSKATQRKEKATQSIAKYLSHLISKPKQSKAEEWLSCKREQVAFLQESTEQKSRFPARVFPARVARVVQESLQLSFLLYSSSPLLLFSFSPLLEI